MRNFKIALTKKKLSMLMMALIYSFAVIAGSTFSWFTAGDAVLNPFKVGVITSSNGLKSLPSGFWEIMRHVVEGETYALIITERPLLSDSGTNLYVPWVKRQDPIDNWLNGIGYETCPQVVRDAAVGAADVTTITSANTDATGLSRPDPAAMPFAFAISTRENHIRWIHNAGKPYAVTYRYYWSRSKYSDTQARYIQYTGNDTWGDLAQANVGVRPAIWVKVDYAPVPDSPMIVNPTLEYRFRNLVYTGTPVPMVVSSEVNEMSGDLVHLAATSVGSYIEFTIPGITLAGTYSLVTSTRKNREMGTVRASVNGVNLGNINLYGFMPSFENVDFGDFTLSSDVTDLKVRFTVTALSTYYGDRSYITLHSLMLVTPKIT